MKKAKWIFPVFLITASFGTNPVWADKVTLKENISAAREKVLTLVKGEGDPQVLKSEIAALTVKVDSEVNSIAGLKQIWDKFKTNRDTKIIPAFDGTHPASKEDAKKLAGGEQKKLFGEMMSLLE